MTAPASFDEAMSTLTTAIEDTLSLLNPPRPEPAQPPPRPDQSWDGPTVPVLHLDPGIDPEALVHALRHALHR
ncbi:hypothetical protein [Streptomyces sp. SID3343]|uniref:hypothetical protein n=1 Tax=Streptomyces sp. SID3343 TaxID=2690260 RepID=UPI0013691E29|nr:hypothetical protein [Streptomyces sp. SID3343]MYV98496.1 hypothetical protein [Streptomyces sp. SID3343]